MHDFLIFALVGFLAQVVDGALGMAYGLTATAALLSFGVPPAHASAATHAAELFTTASSAASHLGHRNVDWKVFRRLAPAGMIGGALGAYVLTGIDGRTLTPFIFTYLGAMAIFIIYRTLRPGPVSGIHPMAIAPLGAAGGFADAVGGGGWGPVVTTTLVGAGEPPRYAIGTVNTAEFLVTAATSAAFAAALFSGRWEDAGDIGKHAAAVGGLVAGGIVAAPFAGYAVRKIPHRTLGLMVGLLILALSIYQLARWMKWI